MILTDIYIAFRDQNKANRPDFSEIVDELLDIAKETPESKQTEVKHNNYFYMDSRT
jgi:hypothetical protein